jgi:hypothetical protein
MSTSKTTKQLFYGCSFISNYKKPKPFIMHFSRIAAKFLSNDPSTSPKSRVSKHITPQATQSNQYTSNTSSFKTVIRSLPNTSAKPISPQIKTKVAASTFTLTYNVSRKT